MKIPTLAAALFLVACTPAKAPSPWAHEWMRLESDHFVLVTDQSRGDAEAALRTMEEVHYVLSTSLLPGDDDTLKIQLVGFRQRDAFEAFARRGAHAFVARLWQDDGPTIVYADAATGETRETMTHELVHAMLARRFVTLPTWFNEGFAEYASTVEVRGGHAYFGRSIAGADRFIGSGMPSLSSLLRMKPAEFYARRDDEHHDLRYDERVSLASHYVGAWAAVHMFQTGPEEYRPRFASYVDALHGGASHDAAWARAFGDVPMAALEKAYGEHLARRFGITWRTPLEERPYRGRMKASPLGQGEGELLHAKLLLVRGDAKGALARVQAAVQREPTSVPALLALARVSKPEERRGVLARALALAPDDPDVLDAYYHDLVRARPAGQPPSDEEVEVLGRFTQSARTAHHFNQVAWAKAQLGSLAVGLAFAKKAVAMDPTCYACFDTLAFVLHARGDLAGALSHQRRAAALVPEGVRDPEVEQRLEQFEREARGEAEEQPRRGANAR